MLLHRFSKPRKAIKDRAANNASSVIHYVYLDPHSGDALTLCSAASTTTSGGKKSPVMSEMLRLVVTGRSLNLTLRN